MRVVAVASIAFLLDLLLGDPAWLPHPVRLLGRLISCLDVRLRALAALAGRAGDRSRDRAETVLGAVLAALVLLASSACWFLAVYACHGVSPLLSFAFECLLSYQLLAVRSLYTESMKVYGALKKEGLAAARRAVSMIVGRDTEALDEAGVERACVETVAENCSDGGLAPLFFLFLGGSLPLLLYKAVNTMDSMVGYKNDTYRRFGTAAARLDDAVNFLPSRLCGLLLVAAAFLCGEDGRMAFRIFQRDRRRHASPNSAQTEAAMAGALHLKLAGDASYFGRVVHKPSIGDGLRPIEAEDIPRANRLHITACLLGFLLLLAVRLALLLAAARAGLL